MPRWPEHALLTGMTAEKRVIFRSRDRMCDLHDSLCDNLMEPLADEYYLAVSIEHPGLRTANDDGFEEEYWDDTSLTEVESAIHDDFAFDDCVVFVERVFGDGWPKRCAAVWNIAPMEPNDD